ncbi:unnamed protein product [Linum tenue]|uniref:Uncharacterized protein n=1 Tax=Linum tenue TaxID=586396 RepID=A0AAV0RHZ5_9ROSI|nr:unnamed protein product [Linum tenue]
MEVSTVWFKANQAISTLPLNNGSKRQKEECQPADGVEFAHQNSTHEHHKAKRHVKNKYVHARW